MASEHVVALVAATRKIRDGKRERLAAVAAAHDTDGLSYPQISRQAFALAVSGDDPFDPEGEGLGPDNLRKMRD